MDQSGDGSYKSDALKSQLQFYSDSGLDVTVVKTTRPYSQTIFEPSPLNRITEQGFPGVVWQPSNVARTNDGGRTVLSSYRTNNSSVNYAGDGYAVRLWNAVPVVGEEYKRSLSSSSYYENGQLYVKITKDENWISGDGKAGVTEEYIDKNNQLILRRTFNVKEGKTEVLSSYYVYDDFGDLSFVLPPGSNPDSETISQNNLDLYCYQYRYDDRKRLIEKRIPGMADWIELIYNSLDQLVFSQDPLQRKNNKRSFIKYDGLGRVIMNGVVNNSTATRAQLQELVNSQLVNWERRIANSSHGYSNETLPSVSDLEGPELVNYYDDYSIAGIPSDESINYSKKTL